MLNITQWGIAFDEMHEKNAQIYSPAIHELIHGAIHHDSFQMKKINDIILLYPKEMANAIIAIDMTQTKLDIRTKLLWKQIEEWVIEEKNAYG